MFEALRKYRILGLCGFLLNADVGLAAEDTLGYESQLLDVEASIGVGYDSNLYDSSSEVESSFYSQPNIKASIQVGDQLLGGQANYEFDAFIPESSDDVAQSNIASLEAHWSPSIRQTVFASALHNEVDEQRGTGLTEDDPFSVTDLDTYVGNAFELGYRFVNPRQESVLLNVAYSEANKEYDSSRSTALNANYEQNYLNMDLGYQWTVGKAVYAELNYIDYRYPDSTDSSQNSVNQIIGVGLDWELSSALDVFAFVGEESKTFDISDEYYQTDYWNLVLTWSPLSYTQFEVESSNEQEPLTEVGQTLNEVETFSLSWAHSWSSDYRSLVQLSREKAHSIVSGVDEIEEELLIGMSVYYKEFGLAFKWEQENGDDSGDFSQFSIALSFTLEGGF